MKTRTSSLLIAFGLALLLPATALAEPTIRAEGATLIASGITPGAAVHWLGATRELHGGHISIVHRHHTSLLDEDRDGVVTYQHDRALPTLAVFAAVDGATGEVAVYTPEDFDPGEHAPATSRWQRAAAADARFQLSGFRYEVLLVRPGEGAWSGEIADGGPADADGERDGLLTLTGKGLAATAESGPAPPEALHDGDVAVFLDARMLWTFTTRLDPAGSTPDDGGLGR